MYIDVVCHKHINNCMRPEDYLDFASTHLIIIWHNKSERERGSDSEIRGEKGIKRKTDRE